MEEPSRREVTITAVAGDVERRGHRREISGLLLLGRHSGAALKPAGCDSACSPPGSDPRAALVIVLGFRGLTCGTGIIKTVNAYLRGLSCM